MNNLPPVQRIRSQSLNSSSTVVYADGAAAGVNKVQLVQQDRVQIVPTQMPKCQHCLHFSQLAVTCSYLQLLAVHLCGQNNYRQLQK